MDVTARELREGNIRDALRGYNHDDVDELLERAAATIDGLQARVSELTERVTRVESEASRGRETEEQLSRTLLVAQRTADEVVEEARAAAQRIATEAQEQAARIVGEAEREAKTEIEAERRRLEAAVLELAETREVLDGDVRALREFADELRGRLRAALEAQIAELDARRIDVSGRPERSEVVLPVPEERVERAPAPEPHGGDLPDAEPPAASPDADLLAVDEAVVLDDADDDEVADEAGAGREVTDDDGLDTALVAAVEDEPPIGRRAATAGEVLDDDSFFASLRDAVRDDRPLGPREDALGPPETHGDLFDQDEDERDQEHRGLFRRRR